MGIYKYGEFDLWGRHVDPKGYADHLRAVRDDARRNRRAKADDALSVIRAAYGVDPSIWPLDSNVVLDVLERAGIAARGPEWLNAAMKLCGMERRFRYRRRAGLFEPQTWLEVELRSWLPAALVRNEDASEWLSDVVQAAYEHVSKRYGYAKAEQVSAQAIAGMLRSMRFRLTRGSAGMRIYGARLK